MVERDLKDYGIVVEAVDPQPTPAHASSVSTVGGPDDPLFWTRLRQGRLDRPDLKTGNDQLNRFKVSEKSIPGQTLPTSQRNHPALPDLAIDTSPSRLSSTSSASATTRCP